MADAGPTQTALECALALAEAHGAALEVIACIDPPHDLSILSRLSGVPSDRLVADATARMHKAVHESLSRIAPDRQVALFVAVGKVYLATIRHVARTGCDFVVKSAEPLVGLDRFLFASTDQHLLRKCPCPVWLLTPEATAHPRRILAAVDLDISDAAEPDTLAALNRRVVDAACTLATAAGAEVIVLHAWDAMAEGMVWAFAGGSEPRISADRYVNEILDARHDAMDRLLGQVRLANGPAPRFSPRLVRGAPERVIQDQCREIGADLVAMGTVARTGLSGVFIGNTAENIINSLECPVLAVKPDGFVSPLLHA